MDNSDLQFISEIIGQRTGINLSGDGHNLIANRLPKVARKHNINNLDELVESLKSSFTSQISTDVIDAITTNESLFFRDIKPFEQLKNIVLPNFRNKFLNLWSAGVSTGQEAYSAAITCEESNFKSYNITATDLSTIAIQRAIEGKYSQFEVQRGLPIIMLIKYFLQDGADWVACSLIREKIKFQNFNLIESYASLGKFDVIMCRNVLTYFTDETKLQVLEKFAQAISPSGYLFLGNLENISNLTTKFKAVDGEAGMFQLV